MHNRSIRATNTSQKNKYNDVDGKSEAIKKNKNKITRISHMLRLMLNVPTVSAQAVGNVYYLCTAFFLQINIYIDM